MKCQILNKFTSISPILYAIPATQPLFFPFSLQTPNSRLYQQREPKQKNNIKIGFKMSSKQITFESVLEQFSSQFQYEKYLQESESLYQLKIYRVNTMTRKQALNYYRQLQVKYNNNTYQPTLFGWYENQRRLFVWFIVCYSRIIGNYFIHNQSIWQQFCQIFQKDPMLLKYQYMSILKKSGRIHWTPQEDQILTTAITYFFLSHSNYPKGEWNQIAKQLFFSGKSTQFKSPKNCRERWNNHLNSEVKKDKWTEEQDSNMLMAIQKIGKKWSQVAKQLGEKRTQHQIKNRYKSLISQSLRQFGKSEQKIVQKLIESYKHKKQLLKYPFINTIIVKQEQKTKKSDRSFQIHQIRQNSVIKQQIESNDQKKQYTTIGGTLMVNCGNKNSPIDRSFNASIEEKLFTSSSFFFSDFKIENSWLDKSILNSASNNNFLEDSSNFQKKAGSFKLSQKGSIQKSEVTGSLDIFKILKSDMSQDYKMLTSSNTDLAPKSKFEFSNDIKEL